MQRQTSTHGLSDVSMPPRFSAAAADRKPATSQTVQDQVCRLSTSRPAHCRPQSPSGRESYLQNGHSTFELPSCSATDVVGVLQTGSDLCAAMSSLGINKTEQSNMEPLKGLPLHQGRHTRFNDSDAATPQDSPRRLRLRGVPAAAGLHLHFDE